MCITLMFMLWATLPQHAPASVSAPHVRVALVADHQALLQGQMFELGVRFTPEPGWHIYWQNPGDSGEAPTIDLRLPPFWKTRALRWPTPKALPQPPLMNYGYDEDVVIAATA